MGTKDKKHIGVKTVGNNHLILLDLWDIALAICSNSTETLGKRSVSVEQQWWALLEQRLLKHAGTILKALQSLQTILERYWKYICKRNKMIAAHSSSASWESINYCLFENSL